MQEQMAKAQEELANETVEASAGGGLVTVKATGGGEILSIKIDPKAIDPDDPSCSRTSCSRRERGAALGAGARAVEARRRRWAARRARPAGALSDSTLRIDAALAAEPSEPGDFTGRVRMQNLARPAARTSSSTSLCYFDAGPHTRPHTHATDQVLCFVQGSGFVWLAARSEHSSCSGTSSSCRRALVHMHGATDDRRRSAISAVRAPGPTDWSPPVPDEWRQSRRLSTGTMGPCSARPWTISSRS